MPLIHGKSKKAFKKNVETEMEAHPGPEHRAQNLAIAYSMKKKAKKMADGGSFVDKVKTFMAPDFQKAEKEKNAGPMPTYQVVNEASKPVARKDHNYAEGGFIGSHQAPGMGHTVHINVNPEGEYDPTQSPGVHPNEMAMHEADKDLNQHGAGEVGPGGYAEGGFIGSHQGPEHDEEMLHPSMNRMMPNHELEGSLGHKEDIVGRIMMKRYSQGGKIANEDSGESASINDHMAKSDPNEFDDLALRDDLEMSYTGANSGDEHGSKLNQTEDRYSDMVGRIMKKRAMRT